MPNEKKKKKVSKKKLRKPSSLKRRFAKLNSWNETAIGVKKTPKSFSRKNSKEKKI